MSPIIEKFSIDEIENLLCRIDDVKAVRIVVDPNHNIEEIHVMANSSKDPKQLSRDIESVLMARYGLPVNHRKISIAQINNRDIKVNKSRPKLVLVKHEVFGRKAKVSVILEYAGIEYEGVEDGPTSKMGRIRLVASATLRAIEKIISDVYGFALEDITAINLGRDMAVVTSIAVLSSNNDEMLAGCALVRGDEREAIVRAVLDAVNRRLEILMMV